MTDPDDPLRGLDPYPRERIEGLHQERAQLLEEIVSTPGPGKQPASTPSKVLLAVGVAAALVVVGGGGWLLASNDSDDSAGDQVAAATSASAPAPASSEPTSTTPSSAPSSRAESPTRPQHAVKVTGHRCDQLRTRDLQHVLKARSGQLRSLEEVRKGRYYVVLKRHGCVLQLGPRHHR
ncbi:hypothetical protein [Nocardioides panacisoli]|uniref:Uncharacterized protein n=1 Tax=Nocardioides panacisoli TaxID=627624 RepID=A0ABP7IUJ4_9ACTN